jgi:hypothetical protein
MHLPLELNEISFAYAAKQCCKYSCRYVLSRLQCTTAEECLPTTPDLMKIPLLFCCSVFCILTIRPVVGGPVTVPGEDLMQTRPYCGYVFSFVIWSVGNWSSSKFISKGCIHGKDIDINRNRNSMNRKKLLSIYNVQFMNSYEGVETFLICDLF